MTDTKKAAEKKKRDIIITSVLLVIFAFTFTKSVLMRKSGPSPKAVATKVDESRWMTDHLVYTTNLRSNDNLRSEQENIWGKDWARDPFVPLAAFSTISKAVNLTLGGILWDDVKPKVIVNGKTLYNGDAIYGYTVDKIKPKSVVLKTGEKTIELTVFGLVEDASG